MRQSIVLGAAAILVGISAFTLGCSKQATPPADASPLTAVTLQTNWYAEAEYGGFYEAVAKGYFREAGLDVKIIQGGPGAYPVQKVATGQVQFGVARSDDLILAAQQKLPVMMVAAQLEHDPQVILVHAESPVHTFADLDGQSIMAEPGSAWITYLQRKYKIRIFTIPENYDVAEFLSDKKFIQQGFLTNEPYVFEQQKVPARSLLIADCGYDPYRIVLCSRGFAHDHPEIVRAFVKASIRGWKEYLSGDATEAHALITKDCAQSTPPILAFARQQIIKAGIAAGDPAKSEAVGLITRSRIADQLHILTDLGLVKEPMQVDDVASFDFLPPDLQALAK